MHEEAMPRYPLMIPRNAYTLREVARAGDFWRAAQDVAVDASIRAGWPPLRYKAERTAYVMRSMVCVHHRETTPGEALTSQTWISKHKRELVSVREIRVAADDGHGRHVPVVEATQEWVHVSSELKLLRMPRSMLESFPVHPGSRTIEFPAYEQIDDAREHRFEFECWQTWSDALGHVNHPVYVDFCEEAVARAVLAAGLDPVQVQPIAETVLYRRPVCPGDRVVVVSCVVGTVNGGVVMSHVIQDERGDVFAEATTARRVLACDGARLLDLLR